MPRILLTKAYKQQALQDLLDYGFNLESVDFITTHQVALEKISSSIPKGVNQFIVSSLKAAEQLVQLDLTGKYFCVGNKSAQFLKEHGKNVVLVAHDAINFLHQIENIPQLENHFVYFCSQIRRDTLPQGMRNQGFQLKEIVAYHTVSKAVEIDNNFDALAFFSPSGVNSYTQQYDIPEKAIIFALGNTTAEEVSAKLNQQAIIPKEPNFESLTQTIKAHLDAKK